MLPPSPDSLLTQTVTIAPRRLAAAVPGLTRGKVLGRYVVLERLGEGGMGVVYSAFDPELERMVALKVLRPERLGSAAELERVGREAKAVARLSHPNVVTVFDVGREGEQVFIAMELVDGETLRAWVGREPRPWREVLRRLLDAGQGLAAAHAAGLVHRDFKLDNVLVDRSGRVRVVDFGLACDVTEEASAGSGSPGREEGTPGYMAPEQWRGEEADALADQFSFAVAAWEALTGARPFPGKGRSEILAAIDRGPVPPRGRRLPAFAEPALCRALAADPEARFPCLSDLLAALERDPWRLRRRWFGLAAVLGLAGAAVGGALVMEKRRGQVCSGGDAKLALVWNEARRSDIAAVSQQSGLPGAVEAWGRAEQALGIYIGEWAAEHRAACEATELRREQSSELLDRRTFCLDQRLGEVRAVVDLLARPDATVIANLDRLISRLPSLAPCADSVALLARVPPPDGEARARVEALRARLAAARALAEAGKEPEALPLAREVVSAAEELGDSPLLGAARFLLASVLDTLDQAGEAEEVMFAALTAAQAGGDVEGVARASAELARISSERLANLELGRRWLAFAEATVAGSGAGAALRADLLKQQAALLYSAGEFQAAITVGKNALQAAEKAYGRDHREVANLLAQLTVSHLEAGEPEAALPLAREALAIRERVLPAGHPDFARSFNALGNAVSELGQLAEAGALYQRAYDVARQRYGPAHRLSIGIGSNLTILLKLDRRFDEALLRAREALAGAEALYPADHPEIGRSVELLAQVLMEAGRPAEAIPVFERALSIYAHGIGADHPYASTPEQGIGHCLLRLGRAHEAVPHLRRALGIRTREGSPVLVAESRFGLAKALWESGGSRSDAVRLARAAERGYAENHRPEASEEVAAWLRTHAPTS